MMLPEWKAQVPESAYNITFNRLSPDKLIEWNSWSAGGRDGNNVYYADGSEYGHWNYIMIEEEENYFHEGDILYQRKMKGVMCYYWFAVDCFYHV